MRTALIVENPDVEVELRHADRVRSRTVEVEALVVLLPVALVGVHHVLHTVLGLEVDPIPACWELDVDFQLCVGTGVTNRNSNITSTSLNREEAMIFLVRKKMSGMS